VAVRSYRGWTRSSGRVGLVMHAARRLRGRDVLIVEDICQSGHRGDFLPRHVGALEARTKPTAVPAPAPAKIDPRLPPRPVRLGR